MTQEELLHDIVKRLERIEQGQHTVREDLSAFKQETADNFGDLRTSVRGLKLKASKTWNLLHYFTRDADERIVKTARRVDAIEEHLGLGRKN